MFWGFYYQTWICGLIVAIEQGGHDRPFPTTKARELAPRTCRFPWDNLNFIAIYLWTLGQLIQPSKWFHDDMRALQSYESLTDGIMRKVLHWGVNYGRFGGLKADQKRHYNTMASSECLGTSGSVIYRPMKELQRSCDTGWAAFASLLDTLLMEAALGHTSYSKLVFESLHAGGAPRPPKAPRHGELARPGALKP